VIQKNILKLSQKTTYVFSFVDTTFIKIEQ